MYGNAHIESSSILMPTYNSTVLEKYYTKKAKETKPLNIGLDFDNTLVYARRDALKIAAKEFGIKLSYKKPRDYNYSEYPENMRKRIYELFRTPEFSVDLEIIPGAQDKLNEWKRLGHRLFIITARDLPIREVTDKFISVNFSVVDELHYVDMGTSKAGKFEDLNLDVWIDDSPIDVLVSSKLGIRTCLISNLSTPYNEHLISNPSLKSSVYDKISSINL